MRWWTYIWIGVKERVRYVWYYDVSKICGECKYLEDWGECHYCRMCDECFAGHYRLRRCKIDGDGFWKYVWEEFVKLMGLVAVITVFAFPPIVMGKIGEEVLGISGIMIGVIMGAFLNTAALIGLFGGHE
jgi:hypothetical protein